MSLGGGPTALKNTPKPATTATWTSKAGKHLGFEADYLTHECVVRYVGEYRLRDRG